MSDWQARLNTLAVNFIALPAFYCNRNRYLCYLAHGLCHLSLNRSKGCILVLTDCEPQTNRFRVILKPNASLSWRGNLWFIISVSALALLISLGFALIGAYVILLFYGLEILVLFFSCYYLCRRNLRREVITLSEQNVEIEKGTGQPHQHWCYDRSQTEIRVFHGEARWDIPTVALCCQHHSVELGDFLNKREKIQLINKLKRITRHLQTSPASPIE